MAAPVTESFPTKETQGQESSAVGEERALLPHSLCQKTEKEMPPKRPPAPRPPIRPDCPSPARLATHPPTHPSSPPSKNKWENYGLVEKWAEAMNFTGKASRGCQQAPGERLSTVAMRKWPTAPGCGAPSDWQSALCGAFGGTADPR